MLALLQAGAVLTVLQQLLILSLRACWGPSCLLLSTGEDAALLFRAPKVEGVLLLLALLLRRLRLLLMLCWGVLVLVLVLAEDGLLVLEAVGLVLVGCRGCFVRCLLPLLMTLNTGPLPAEDFHLLLLEVLLGSVGEGFALILKAGVTPRWPD